MYARICTVVDQNKIGQIVSLGPDFKSWWQIGGAAQMCNYLCSYTLITNMRHLSL
jgi:hypothetical protein